MKSGMHSLTHKAHPPHPTHEHLTALSTMPEDLKTRRQIPVRRGLWGGVVCGVELPPTWELTRNEYSGAGRLQLPATLATAGSLVGDLVACRQEQAVSNGHQIMGSGICVMEAVLLFGRGGGVTCTIAQMSKVSSGLILCHLLCKLRMQLFSTGSHGCARGRCCSCDAAVANDPV